MLRDAKQIFWFSLVACVLFVGSIRAQDTPSQQTSPPAKPSSAQAQSQTRAHTQQRSFSSPQQAAEALCAAARNHDTQAMLAILGPDARDLVMWTDDADERHAQDDQFTKKYDQMHRFVKEPDNETTLYVGAENWPLPFPLVERNGAWYFDSNLGRREIMYRRIGENEMMAINALNGIVSAENEFDGDSGEYAQHLNCSGAQHDGLFSAANASDEATNAIGPYLAEASYERSDRMPFHGYFFRILTAQGPHAHGGAHNYVVDGKMTGGFAVVAFPAVYRSSGVKTFVVNEHGRIWEKDLGANTTQLAAGLKSYDPDSTWTRVRPDEFLSMNSGSPE